VTGALVAYRWELRKLVAQKRTYIGLGAAAVLPVVFVTVMALQKGGPYDAPLGHNLRRTGLALALVVLNCVLPACSLATMSPATSARARR